jgi:hypothetical protein
VGLLHPISTRAYHLRLNNPTIPTVLQVDETLILQVGLPHLTSTGAYRLKIATTNGKPPWEMINKDTHEGQS